MHYKALHLNFIAAINALIRTEGTSGQQKSCCISWWRWTGLPSPGRRVHGPSSLTTKIPRTPCHGHTLWPRLLKSPGKAGSRDASSSWAWLRLCLLHWGFYPSCLLLLLLPSVQALSYDESLHTKHPMGPTLACLMLAPFSVTEVSFTQFLNIVRYFGYIGKVQIRKQSTSVKVRNRAGKTSLTALLWPAFAALRACRLVSYVKVQS